MLYLNPTQNKQNKRHIKIIAGFLDDKIFKRVMIYSFLLKYKKPKNLIKFYKMWQNIMW